jgi:hypothetical protein
VFHIHFLLFFSSFLNGKKISERGCARARSKKRLYSLIRDALHHSNSSNSNAPPLNFDPGSDSDCGYIGGVNHKWLEDSDDSDWSDGSESDLYSESISELEGSELEENLKELQKEASELQECLKFKEVLMAKSASEFKIAEKDRQLGYTGLSRRTKQRREKEARERAGFGEKAKTS